MKFIEDKNTISIDIYINDEFMEKRKLLKTEKLINIRNSLNDLISKDAIFLSKEKAEILKNDENEFFLIDIIDSNKLNFLEPTNQKNKTNKNTNNPIKNDEKILIEIYLNDELKASKKLNKLESLIKVRESLESKNLGNYKFCLQTGEVIQLEEENNYKLIDILKGNQINIQKIEKSKLNQNPNLNLKKEKIIIDIFINDQLISSKKLNVMIIL